ncbi:MAG: carboxylating nicotinate-nucleotide diphosphorylase [Verrucomicrobiae bacterium]|nr:carboxylating nicotinate-nucleotide diphosphorylase [Verrucomicrobiae bacterium]
MQTVPEPVWREAVRRALREDVGPGDVTSLAVVPRGLQARALMVARQPLVVCGLEAARLAFQMQHRSVRLCCCVHDGEAVRRGTVLMEITGPACALLTAERVALNFVQRLSGIATLTAAFVRAVRGTQARILDTRKTTPGLRLLEKYAVACGGGVNHRLGLHDLVLIKDNHLAALQSEGPHPIIRAVQRARARYPHLKVEVEADTLAQVEEAVRAGADFILLDNMTPRQLREAVRRVAGRARTEASGGVTLRTVRAIARTGVDFISVGALTHSAPAVDVALDFVIKPELDPPTRRRRAPASRL